MEELWNKVKQPLISGALAFVFSGFNPVAAVAAGLSTATLNTGEGRSFVKSFGNEFFDDVLGMRPKAAYIWSAIVSNTVLTLGLEAGISNIMNPTAKAVPFDKSNPQDMAMLNNPKGKYPFGKFPAKKGNEYAFDYDKLKTLAVDGNRVAIIGTEVKNSGLTRFGIPVKHSGAIASNFPGEGIENISVLGLKGNAIYGTLFGTCHQATNQTLFGGGLSNTVWNLGWEFKASTAIYGNYGGGLIEKVYWGAYYYNES